MKLSPFTVGSILNRSDKAVNQMLEDGRLKSRNSDDVRLAIEDNTPRYTLAGREAAKCRLDCEMEERRNR